MLFLMKTRFISAEIWFLDDWSNCCDDKFQYFLTFHRQNEKSV